MASFKSICVAFVGAFINLRLPTMTSAEQRLLRLPVVLACCSLQIGALEHVHVFWEQPSTLGGCVNTWPCFMPVAQGSTSAVDCMEPTVASAA